MPPLPHNDNPDLDEERKKELIMEKKLRACRVNILPRNAGYFAGGPQLPPPVKKPPAPSPSPKSVEKASNPIALRYWNQCTTDRKISAPALMPSSAMSLTGNESPPWVTSDTNLSVPQVKPKARTPTSFPVRVPDITKRVRSESVPRFCNFDDEPLTYSDNVNVNNNIEVVKVLSTAGTGIKRDNEKIEALGNINRFITMDKMKKDDATRAANNKVREVQMKDIQIEHIKDDKDYLQVKQEQIKLTNERTNFMNNATTARIPRSPEPFRGGRHRDISEPRPASRPDPRKSFRPEPPKEKPPSLNANIQSKNMSNERNIHVSNGQTINNKTDNILSQIKALNDEEKRKVFLTLFNEMSFNTKSIVMADILEELKPQSASREIGNQEITNSPPVSGAAKMISDDDALNKINNNCRTDSKHDNSKVNDVKEKNVVNALPDNKSAQDEVKNHETNFVNVSSRQPVQKHETESSNEAFEAELPICKVVVQEIDQEDAINQVVSVNIPEIRVDLSDDSADSVEDPQAEWEWEDGEELEYEFYEHEITKL